MQCDTGRRYLFQSCLRVRLTYDAQRASESKLSYLAQTLLSVIGNNGIGHLGGTYDDADGISISHVHIRAVLRGTTNLCICGTTRWVRSGCE